MQNATPVLHFSVCEPPAIATARLSDGVFVDIEGFYKMRHFTTLKCCILFSSDCASATLRGSGRSARSAGPLSVDDRADAEDDGLQIAENQE